MLFSILCFHCTSDHGVSMHYRLLSPAESGINFRNDLEETHEMNIISYPDCYSGGGVSIGDIDNDGDSDAYAANQAIKSISYIYKHTFLEVN